MRSPRFSALLSRKIYDGTLEAQNEKERRRIKYLYTSPKHRCICHPKFDVRYPSRVALSGRPSPFLFKYTYILLLLIKQLITMSYNTLSAFSIFHIVQFENYLTKTNDEICRVKRVDCSRV